MTQDEVRTKAKRGVRFADLEEVPGPIFQFNKIRHKILGDCIHETFKQYEESDLELLLAEALYIERRRMAKVKRFSLEYILTFRRQRGDRKLWKAVQAGLLKKPSEVDRKKLLRMILRHYGDEIGAHFSLSVYRLARRLVPWIFSWLLNAAHVRRFSPWGMTESLRSRLRVVGEVEALQELAKKGTILLVPTHQSNIDNILIGYVIYLMSLPPFSFGGGLNLFSNPVLSFLLSNLGAYTVDRQKTNQIYKTLLKNYSTRVLRERIHCVFYPGGGRSRSGAVESHLKLGLLGTGLAAEIQNHKEGRENPRVFVVPMTTSYHFVLEAGSLVDQYLQESGRHLFLRNPTEEPPPLIKLIKFFWKFFATESTITVRFGQALDVFGNPVNLRGESLGPNGTVIDPTRWLETEGELKAQPQRDSQYTRQLGAKIVDSYYTNNVVLHSHLAAFALFTAIRKRYKDLDIFRFVRLSRAQRSVPYEEFVETLQDALQRLRKLEQEGKVQLCLELQDADPEAIKKWLPDAVTQLGVMHEAPVIRISDGAVWSEDLSLLYYYRNRLSGYGLTLYATREGVVIERGQTDEKGFLA